MTEHPGPAGTRAIAALPHPPDPALVLPILREMRGELAEKLGIEITEFTRERVVATMPVGGNRQPFGLLHGGASAALAETMGSFHGSLVGAGLSRRRDALLRGRARAGAPADPGRAADQY